MEENISTVHLLARIESLEKRIREVKPDLIPSRSADLKELFTALAKAQAEMQCAGRKSENPYFKSSYADLAEIVRVSRPALAKNGLSVIQQVLPNEDGQNILHTILAHSSGQWIESRMRILPSKPDVQSLQSYITYIRRSAYSALIGVTVMDEDDDAEQEVATQRETYAKGVALNTKYNPREESYESLTKEQLDEVNYELQEYPDIAEQVLSGLKIQNLSDIPKSKYSVSLRRIREIKQARNGIK
jgi:ERF superfamily